MANKLPRPRFTRIIEVPDSDWVKTIEYDPDTHVMDLELSQGERYRYRDIPAELFTRVITAKSVGCALNTHIVHLPHRRLLDSQSKSV